MPRPVQYREEDKVRSATARLATLQRPDRETDPERLEEARQELIAARLERAIFEALNPEPPYSPLTADRRGRLADMLTGTNLL
jgi:hypothetical protein